jgi:uncharacterized RDD family membrane protein YckC
MDSAEPPGTGGSAGNPNPPADARRRAAARALDLLLPLGALQAPGAHARALALCCAVLVLCADSLFGPGRSLGKRVFGLRAILLATRRPAPVLATLQRNAPFALALLPALFGLRWEAVALLACTVALEAAVALRPLARDLGQRRLGDYFAGTQVVDGSIAIPLSTPLPARRAQLVAAVPPAPRLRRPHPQPVSLKPEASSKEPACA